MCDFYTLLTSAHYKTTPLDLRRLMDGVGNHLYGSFAGDVIAAALWMVDEGGLDESLAKAVWAGQRRPKGNLVAQSLAAHGGQWQAAVLRSRRISRIAVFPAWRHQGVAKSLVVSAIQQAREEGLDFVSVSFGYTPELYHSGINVALSSCVLVPTLRQVAVAILRWQCCPSMRIRGHFWENYAYVYGAMGTLSNKNSNFSCRWRW